MRIVSENTHVVNAVDYSIAAEHTPGKAYPTAVTVDPKRLAKMVSAALQILKDHEQEAQKSVLEVSR